MKSFTYKIHEKLNKSCNAGNGSGRPAAVQRASRAPGSRRAHNNAGFSLPEIIVAMLIVGIVITPLLTNFAVTARVNAKSLKTKDVTDYAEQIMETLQSYTPDEVDEQFGSDKAEDFKIAEISNTKTNYGRTDSSFKTDDRKDADKAKAADGKPRYYFIRGAKAPSGRSYDVQITYDPTAYRTAGTADGSVHAYNLEEFPDSAAFSRSTTAIINPNDSHVTFPTGSDGKNIFDEDSQSYEFENNTSYEDMAVNGFYGVYTAFIGEVRTKFEDLLQQKGINSSFVLKNEDLMDGLSESQKKAQLRNETLRYTLIMIDAANDKVYLTSYLQFQLTDVGDVYMMDKASVKEKARKKLVNLKSDVDEDITVTDDEINTIVDEAEKSVRQKWNRDIVPSYKVSYNSDGYSKLSTVYLMIKPLSTDFKQDRIAVYFTKNAGKIYNSKNRLELYFVPQIGLLKNKTPDNYIKPEITGAKQPVISDNLDSKIVDTMTGAPADKLSVYYAKDWFMTSGVSFENLRGHIDDKLVKTISADLIYNVKVTVYESSNGNWRNKLAELNTSTQQ